MSRYFKTRALAQAPDYERAYWHVTVDPDGRERFRADERAQHLDDVREEATRDILAWLAARS